LSPAGSLSDSLHVNLLGYRPDAPQKFGYLYAWEGDGGSLDVRPYVGRRYEIVDAETGRATLTGTVAFRFARTNHETQNLNDTPGGNFLGADVAECDFSALQTAGRYYLQIPGIGRSRVFSVQPDVYRVAFHTVMKGILGNRSGIDLAPPAVAYHRPAPHNALLTPGFAGKLKYTRSRYLDRKNADYSPDDKAAVEAGIVGDLSVSGWYQDAGDWDSYETHIQVPENLMLAYQLAPQNWAPGELGLPDKASKLPDILREAEWLPSFCYRLRHELLSKGYGTGGIGLRICGDHFGTDTGPNDVGRGSWQDVDRIWTASGEDPVSTFGYAGAAAQFALCLRQAGVANPAGIDWSREAAESYAWAASHSKPGDETEDDYAAYRTYALCGLAALTGDAKYERPLLAATAGFGEGTRLWWSAIDGPAVYLLSTPSRKNPVLVERFSKAIYGTADAALESASKRALRWAGDWGMPMLVGQQTTPWVAPVALASVLTRTSAPDRSRAYFAAVETTADYFLGTNPLNQTWVSGLGPKFPRDPFSLDGWYEDGQYPRPGIVPYGPWIKSKAKGQGPWDVDWANKSVYPPIDNWPGAERWFDNRCCPLTNEFTIHQNLAPAALAYGFLCGRVRTGDRR
jgi:endoglucanase